MDDETTTFESSGKLTPERVAAGAIQQAARHERALRACLAELDGDGAPRDDLTDATRQRAMRHANRAIGLAKTAIRMNRDPLAQAFFAALLERYERNVMLVEQVAPAASTAELPIAG
ncbi:MAG: hypothetical protein U0893_14110 [Chloroflexota bacterium]